MAVAAEASVESRHHLLHSYVRDDELVDAVGAWLAEGVRRGAGAVVIATPEHRLALEASIDALCGEAPGGHAPIVVWLDAADTLAKVVVDGRPDRAAFNAVIGAALQQAATGSRTVVVYGEIVALLWEAGDVTGAIEIETLWNELESETPFALACGYPLKTRSDELSEPWQHVCRLHSALLSGDGVGTAGEVERSSQFVGTPLAVRAARRFVAETLAGWQERSLLEDAAIVLGELAVNAVVHADGDFTVTVSRVPGAVRIAVSDASRAMPKLQRPGPSVLSGRGLLLVARLASDWGVDVVNGGKVVWAELRT